MMDERTVTQEGEEKDFKVLIINQHYTSTHIL